MFARLLPRRLSVQIVALVSLLFMATVFVQTWYNAAEQAEFAEEGRRRGVKLEAGADPTRVPIWSPFFRQWLVLARDGAHLTGVTDPTLDARRADDWLEVLP